MYYIYIHTCIRICIYYNILYIYIFLSLSIYTDTQRLDPGWVCPGALRGSLPNGRRVVVFGAVDIDLWA